MIVKPVHNENVKLQPLQPRGFWLVFGCIAACDAGGCGEGHPWLPGCAGSTKEPLF